MRRPFEGPPFSTSSQLVFACELMTTRIDTAAFAPGLQERRQGAERPYVLPDAVTSIMRPLLRLAPQFSRYVAVSVFALGVDFSVFLALTHVGLFKASLAGVIGYAVGLVLHFVLSTSFVFERRGLEKSRRRLFAEFAASGLVGVCITWAIIALAVDTIHLPAIVGKVLAVGISFVAVYLMRRTFVFAR